MYHAERKSRFAEQYDVRDTRVTVESMFRSIAPYEEKYGKDVSEMSVAELQYTIDHAFAVKTISKYSKLRYLDKYIGWCSLNGFQNVTDAIKHISTASIDKVRQQLTSNPMHLQRCLDIAFAPVEDETIDIIYRCYLWLGYMEFPEDRIAELTREHLDFNGHVLVFNDHMYTIYQESEKAFRKAAELTEFNYHHDSPSYDIRRSRYMSNGLIRGIKGDFQALTIRPKIASRVREYANSDTPVFQLSYKRLATSGMFYRLYTRERAGMQVDPLNEFYEAFAERGIKKKSAKTLAFSYVNDYERWKFAFSI